MYPGGSVNLEALIWELLRLNLLGFRLLAGYRSFVGSTFPAASGLLSTRELHLGGSG